MHDRERKPQVQAASEACTSDAQQPKSAAGASLQTPALDSNPVIACATDDRYAMPLSVTMRTAARQLPSGKRLTLYVLDGGISEENRRRLERSWCDVPIDVNWLRPDSSQVAGLKTSHHISPVAYYRILLPHVLPESLDRVLYLDCDLLIRANLMELWNQRLNQDWCLAIPDVACPNVDARQGMSNFRRACPYLASLRPIPNYPEFNISPAAPYFNSGVLLINLAAWRREGLPEKMLDCLREHERHVWCWDQYALNIALAGHWRPLPLRWNVGTHVFEYPSIDHAPLPRDQFAEALEDPSIVHFTTEFKPWNYGIDHPYRTAFFDVLDETAWSGWRPEKPPFQLKSWWDRRAVAIQKQVVISYRKLRAVGHPETHATAPRHAQT